MGAAAVAYPQSGFAHITQDKTVLIWDAAHKTEHIISGVTLKGDADSFGILVPTPSAASVARENDDVIDRTGMLFSLPQPGQTLTSVLHRAELGDFEAASIKDETALGDWMAKNKFADKPALRTWAKTYFDKTWVLTAVRSTMKGSGDRELAVPSFRLSFKTDAPVLPYTDFVADSADDAAYRAKSQNGSRGGYMYASGMRATDVYVVGESQMQGMNGQTSGGPPVADALRVASGDVAKALGDTSAWAFDAKARPTWVITHLAENAWQHQPTGDLGFASYDLPKARPGPGVTEIDDRPIGPTSPGSTMAWIETGKTSGKTPNPHNMRSRIGYFALFLLIAAAAGYAIWSEQETNQAKS